MPDATASTFGRGNARNGIGRESTDAYRALERAPEVRDLPMWRSLLRHAGRRDRVKVK
ncbi:MAG: hypothetical protein ACRD19_11930 [Terriglobia bacterium]